MDAVCVCPMSLLVGSENFENDVQSFIYDCIILLSSKNIKEQYNFVFVYIRHWFI